MRYHRALTGPSHCDSMGFPMRMLHSTGVLSHSAVACAVMFAALACSGPDAGTDTAPNPASSVAAIDGAALLRHVSILAADSMEGRALGTPGNARARRYVEAAFRSIGLESFGEGFGHPFAVAGSDAEGVNLIGYVQGSAEPGTFLVITAHYDHLGVRDGQTYNGADDNASGTAGLLELAAHFAANPARHSILFAAVDAEEGGLQGARALVADPPVPLEQIAVDINLDMVSNSDSLLFVAGTHHYPFLAAHVEAVVPQPGVVVRLGHDLPGTGSDDWTSASDHGPFHEVGIPFLYFGVEDHPYYHQPGDTFETINQDFLLAAIETVRQIVEELDERLPEVVAASGR